MDIHYAQLLAKELYDVEMSEDKFEELALIAHNLIGNKNVRIYRYIAKPDSNGELKLPCNCDELEAVSTLWKDWNHVTNKDWNGDWDSDWIEQWINQHPGFKDPLSVPGKYIKYERVGDKLYVDMDYGPLYIVYKGEMLDDNGLPDVSEREAIAIAVFIAQYVKFKQGIATMNKNLIEVSNMLKQEWNIRCDQARSIQPVSQNEWNEILDAKSSWDRHQYGKSYHLVR